MTRRNDPALTAIARDGILRPGLGPATVDGLHVRNTLGREVWTPAARYGEDGWRILRYDGAGSVIVSTAPCPQDDNHLWTHASIAYIDHMPTYDDLVLLHQAVWGADGGWAYQVFAPASDHINLHQYALHLWGRADGSRVLPDFGAEFGSI